MTLSNGCKYATRTFTGDHFSEIGKHLTADLVKGCGEGETK